MHPFAIPQDLAERAIRSRGHLHAFRSLDARRTALTVIDMQNAFVKEGVGNSWVPEAASVCPNINRLAAALRRKGGLVVWVLNTFTEESRDSWSHFHDELSSPAVIKRRAETMAPDTFGHALYADLTPAADDLRIRKTRFSAFIPGSSVLEAELRARGINTLLVAGTNTNVCCESTARDAMMLNFRTIMVSDCCAAHDDAAHSATLRTFFMSFGDVYDTGEVISLLEGGRRKAAAE